MFQLNLRSLMYPFANFSFKGSLNPIYYILILFGSLLETMPNVVTSSTKLLYFIYWLFVLEGDGLAGDSFQGDLLDVVFQFIFSFSAACNCCSFVLSALLRASLVLFTGFTTPLADPDFAMLMDCIFYIGEIMILAGDTTFLSPAEPLLLAVSSRSLIAGI